MLSNSHFTLLNQICFHLDKILPVEIVDAVFYIAKVDDSMFLLLTKYFDTLNLNNDTSTIILEILNTIKQHDL